MYLNYSRYNRFMADHDAWRELAEIYVSLQMLVLFYHLSSRCKGNIDIANYLSAFCFFWLSVYVIGINKQHFVTRS